MAKRMTLEGSFVAMVTPFAGGEIDWNALGKLIDRQIEGGTQGLVPCGTTGESPTLSHEEHDKVVEFTVERAAGRVPVIAGTGSNSTAEALRLTRHAKDAGALSQAEPTTCIHDHCACPLPAADIIGPSS